MHSDAYVTDFDSDDNDIVWPYNDDDDEDHEDQHSVSTVRLEPSKRVYEFGEFEEHYGWVQCRSKSQQNRLYFHNMHSGCNTWYRPVSHNIKIPTVSLEKATCTDDLTTSDLELMSVSDDEKERESTTHVPDRFLTKTSLDILSRWFYAPLNSTFGTKEDNLSEMGDTFAAEYDDEIKWINVDNESNDNGYSDGNDDKSRTEYSSFPVADFLETEILVGEGEVNIDCCRMIKKETMKRRKKERNDDNNDTSSSSSSLSTSPNFVVYGAPRLKKIGFEEQVVKWQDVRPPKNQGGPRKIICEMYGVRTINYDLPDVNEIRPVAGVKSTRLSDSDSDDDDSGLPSGVIANTFSDFVFGCNSMDLRPPLLSDPSSSPSSRSSKSSSSSSNSFTCSTCSTSCTSCE
ncbi:uncharacterized protein LOC105182576 [Harpegnathos saltator]|uniref:WW domain-containing protein n=1 Tax=Harpegnathos saltator TaxID=610380 RepID=E2BGL6_HARSA|nr:uncharacterized protein LOC105182576 [Harpegnathos saltator]EFN85144.1 hypothetical protein EAI_01228 [Harpegnathos saltator]